MAWRHLLCEPQECVGEKGRFFADCAPKFGLRELTGYKLYQPLASVGVRRFCSYVNTLPPCGNSLFPITSESAGQSGRGSGDVVVGIHTRLQINSDVSDNLAVWLSRDDVAGLLLSVGRVPLDVRDVRSLATEKNVLTRASLLSTANHKSEVPLMSTTRVSFSYGPNTLQPSSPIRTQVLALASIKTNR